MEIVRLEYYNETHLRIVAEPSAKMEISEYFTFYVPNYKFMPSYKNKVWDGKVRLLNTMSGLIYRGLLNYIKDFCEGRDYLVDIDPRLQITESYPDDFGTILSEQFDTVFPPRSYQNDAIVHGLRNKRALFLSPTASGKSYIIYILSRFHVEAGRKVLIVVPSISLVTQMASDFIEYNKDRPLDIHQISAGVDKNVDSDYTITTWQSVYKMRPEYFSKFDVIIGDEAHNFKSKSLVQIMERMPNIEYRYGFTGTLDGSQTNKLVLEGLFGSVVNVTETKTLIKDGTLANFKINVLSLSYNDEERNQVKTLKYKEEMDWLVNHPQRNILIAKMAWSLPGNTLVLFQYVEKHGKILYPLMQKGPKDVHFIYGDVKGEDRDAVRKHVESSTNNIILASYGTYSTGVNIKRLDNIVFAFPSKSRIRNLQSIGRVLRKGNGKDKALLIDVVDDLRWKKHENYAVLHFKERAKIYSEEGFEYNVIGMKVHK